jgi:pyruvate/2-oxoglutarate/acetoin dehydrogenase E1 component
VFKWISLKREKPLNYGEFKTPIGVVETMKEGADISFYGSTLRLIEQAAQELLEVGIDCEIIDVQSLLPFDINHDLVKVLPKQVDY